MSKAVNTTIIIIITDVYRLIEKRANKIETIKRIPLESGKDIAAITGATESCDIVTKSVNAVAGIFLDHVLSADK